MRAGPAEHTLQCGNSISTASAHLRLVRNLLHHRRAELLGFFISVAIFGQFNVGHSEAGGTGMRLINRDEAVAQWPPGTQFVASGRIVLGIGVDAGVVAAGKTGARHRQGANRMAVITLQNLAIMRQRLAIEVQHPRRRIVGGIAGSFYHKVHASEGEAEVNSRVGILIVWISIGCGARIIR